MDMPNPHPPWHPRWRDPAPLNLVYGYPRSRFYLARRILDRVAVDDHPR